MPETLRAFIALPMPDSAKAYVGEIQARLQAGQVVGGQNAPILTRDAQTELLVNDSDTIVIGGIIKKNEQESESGWPGAKDIPLMGWLFKTQNENTTNNELLIFITPRIVQLEQRQAI